MYTISGTYNTTPIKKRTFNSYDSAVKYLDSLITSLDVQIEEILSDENTNTYVANYYSRFMISKLA